MNRSKHNPWFVHESIVYLELKLQADWLCFEWGSGWSTLWLAELTEFVISTEHDLNWYEQVNGWLARYDLDHKAMLKLYELDGRYVDCIRDYDDGKFDLIMVDGRRRAECIIKAIDKLKPGGILVIDNSERQQYQAAIETVGIRKWEHADFYSGNSEGWTTSVYYKPKVSG